MSADTRIISRRILLGDIRSDSDRGVELLDEAQAAFEDEARRHPEIDPRDTAQLLRFVHQRLGLSTTTSTDSLAELGKLLGNRTGHTVEVMLKKPHGTTFGDQDLERHVQFLFAGISIAEREAQRLAEESGSDHRLPWDIQRILDRSYDKATGFSIGELYEVNMPQHAVAALHRTYVHTQEIE